MRGVQAFVDILAIIWRKGTQHRVEPIILSPCPFNGELSIFHSALGLRPDGVYRLLQHRGLDLYVESLLGDTIFSAPIELLRIHSTPQDETSNEQHLVAANLATASMNVADELRLAKEKIYRLELEALQVFDAVPLPRCMQLYNFQNLV